jgi:hypothetical protein
MKVLRVLVVASIVAGFVVSRAPVGAAPDQVGKWSAPRQLGIVGVHGAVVHTGKVLFYSGSEGEAAGSVARLFDPATNQVRTVSIPFEHPAFCSGVTVLSDGRVLVAGGQVDLTIGAGVRDVSIFDPVTESWSRGSRMVKARYYPSVVELPDGRVLAVAGSDEDLQDVPELEVYDPATDRWTLLPSSASQISPTYPRLSLLPDGKVLRAGELRQTRQLDLTTNTWTNVARMKYGSRAAGAAVLLPGLTKVLYAGGTKGLAATNTAEVIDMSASAPAWRNTAPMNAARANLNLVLLLDGNVLAVGGGRVPPYGTAVRQAELYDPSTGKWKLMAAQQAQRTYHSTAFLLPDGRVISAGSDFGFQAETYEIFSPPYLFKGPRPAIDSAPGSVGYGQSFGIGTPDESDIERVALVRPGATTHAADFDQRYVELAFSAGTGELQAIAPGSGSEAPPGYYMLVIVNSSGVPSVARFVHLS